MSLDDIMGTAPAPGTEPKKKKKKEDVSGGMRKTLKCPAKKCNYQKVIYKSTLKESDYVCPRCGKKMKLK